MSLSTIKSLGIIPNYIRGEKLEIEAPLLIEQRVRVRDIPNIKVVEYTRSMNKRIYTDGSRGLDGVGAAFVYYVGERRNFWQNKKLNEKCSNFQAEMLAISMALDWINNRQYGSKICICTDSQSAVSALADHNSKHNLTHKIWSQYKRIMDSGTRNEVTLAWVKAHVGTMGNEEADRQAKASCLMDIRSVYNRVPLDVLKTEVKSKYIAEWQQRWQIEDKGRWTFGFFPDIRNRLNNKHFRPTHRISAIVTNHGDLNKYLRKYGHVDSANCETCGVEEDAEHIIYHCVRLEERRHTLRCAYSINGHQWPASLRELVEQNNLFQLLTELTNLFYKLRI
ncbi:uncharacterized protein LOC111634933 [Centruroides sculpturatus]|uniref:uncharacterized protein LOC111634933 n=1 Tax=Centruroides sculpturatus TaxID=218467 RepID=UPI000C6EA920|nr:uncharacterized protein LOC111634933 [Centruroides sculpturatus]